MHDVFTSQPDTLQVSWSWFQAPLTLTFVIYVLMISAMFGGIVLVLLVAERGASKPGAARLMQHLRPCIAIALEHIDGRSPWIQEPDCVSRHTEFYERPDPATVSAFNQWNATGGGCVVCHGMVPEFSVHHEKMAIE
jgi:hypothetical protein